MQHTHEQLKRNAQADDAATRATAAAAPDAPPELLYYLAQDPDPAVRRAAAENPALPPQANMLLARDADHSVRVALAYKIAGDGLDSEARSKMLRMGLTILETLAADQVMRVRAALSRALAKVAEAPRPVVLSLAKDREEDVATPVVESSPVLTEEDLQDLLAGNPPEWLMAAVARRDKVAGALVDVIIDDNAATPARIRAIGDLVANNGAEISDAAMDRIVTAAPAVEAWHEPLVRRERMSEGLLLKLAKFVSAPLLGVLRKRKGLSRATTDALDGIAATRPEIAAPVVGGGVPVDHGAAEDGAVGAGEAGGEARAWDMYRRGALSDDALAIALDNNDRGFVTAALALRAGVPVSAARRVIRVANARVVTALVWKAGMPMRFALDVQRFLARVPGPEQLNARGGVDYPLAEAEMAMLVETFAA